MSNKVKSKFMFTDGSKVYKIFDTIYKKHKKGYVILGPPGCGKTTFVQSQTGKNKHWIDSDDLLGALGVDWHQNEKNNNDFKLNYLRADYMLEQSKLLGYRIIGALFWEYKADAVVIPPLNIHKEFIKNRKDLSPDFLNKMRKIFRSHAKKFKIPIFTSIDDAVEYINSLD